MASHNIVLISIFGFLGMVTVTLASNFYRDFSPVWGDGRLKIGNNGQLLTLSMDKASGSGFKSKQQYLYGKIDMEIKLIPGNSAGTVTTYYFVSRNEAANNEIDLEFLGNLSGNPYTLHTNIYIQGKGNREQQFHLWFDPSLDFHTYSILWNPQTIIFYVDGAPIREFKNLEAKGVPYLKDQPMWIYSSLWNADDWATQGGRVKTDWTQAPFTASFRNYRAQTCAWSPRRSSSCNASSHSNGSDWLRQPPLDEAGKEKIRTVQKRSMIYSYCTDFRRFPVPPPECSLA